MVYSMRITNHGSRIAREGQGLESLLVLITVYVASPPKFVDPWTRGGKADEKSTV